MIVRRADADDEPALRALDQATWSALNSPAPPPDAGESFFAAGRAPEDVLIAELGNGVIGYIRLGPPSPLPSNRHVLEVKGLAVDPAAQRRGAGRALVEAAAHEAGARGARRLTLRVLAPNLAARSLYERCGFRLEGVLHEEFRLDGHYVDDVLMALELEPPEPAHR